ncbi:hypothetical protein Vafri_9381 [Volvox africanus]|uniref:Protein kinase domain-containing protein n=1 Tax=Volvox africanus TaxID=51714 RepID=A0A8J4EZZ2_9CHLO|nr:hypothetical protein Vafri_9381 [Volvox africanus]
MKALSQHQHNRLSRSSSAAGALMSVFRADRRMWPWSPDPDPGPHDHNQQHTNSTELTSVSPSILSSSRSLGSRRRSRRVVPPLGQAASVGGTSAAADAAAAARAVTFPRATASVSTSASTSAARDRRGSNWQELVIAAVTPVAAGPGCSSTESPPSPLVGLPHTGPSLSSPALLTAATSHPRALSGGGGSSGTITAQASRLQISNPSIDAGGVDAAAKAAAGVAAAAADTRGSGGISAPIPTAANSPGARMVRKSPFMIKPSASRLSESTGTAAAENASNLTPSRTEVSPSGGRSGGGGGGGSGGGAVPQLAGAAGGSLASAGASVILQQAFSEPVRPPRVSMVMAATPLPPADSLAGGGGGGGGGGGSGGATVTQPSHGAKPGLGRLLVGSLSNLFRVDSLTGGLQRAASPPPAALTPSGSSLTGMVDRLQTNRTSAVQLADVRQGESPTPSGAGAQRTSNTGSAAGTTVAGIAARGGGSRGVIATPAAMDLGTTLSELTADFESRLNENQLVIQQMLGSGAFGTVYKALWKGLQVAVKTLTLTTDAVTQGRHAALMEAALSKSIFHPNVVTTYTCDLKPMHVDSHRGGAMTGLQILNETEVIQEWRLYIVQEFCDGGSLRHAIEARSFLNSATGTPQMEWVLQMAREIAGGLQYLHEHNIIHGDLNPANVLLRRDDSSVLGYAAKIADFGLSVHMQGEQSHVSNTKRGTPFYTAPEVTHAGNLTRFADVFSYGVVLWELYCSRSCWMYGPQGRLIHQRGFPHLPPSCPRAYATLVSNCMQPAHKQRPSFKQIGVLLSSMLREYEYAARSAAAVVASPSSWYPSQAPSPPQERHLQGLFSAQPYILQSSQYERYSKERSSSPKLPSPQLNQALEPPQLLGRQQPVGQPLQPFQKASNRSSLESSTGGARSSTPTSTCSSPPPPSQQQQLPPAQVGFRSGLAVNVAAAAPIREGVNRRASWEPGTEAGAAAADGTNGPDGGGFVSPRCAAMGGTSDTRSDPDDLSVEPASATAMVSALGPSSSLPLTLLTLPTGVPPEVPSPTALLLGAPSSRTGTPAELPPAVNTVGASAPSESAEGVLAQSPQPVIYRQPAASAAAAAAASVSMTPVASMPPAPLRTGSKSMHTTVAAAAFKGFDGAARQQKPGLPGGGAEQSADLGVAAVTALPPPPLHNVRMVAPAATVAALSTPSTEAALATDSAVVPAAIAGDAPVNSGGGGGGGIVVPSSALAGVMRAFDIPAELPRFAPPDLPTVLEAEDEPTSGSHSVRSVSSHIPMPLGDSASLPDGSPMPDDFPLIEGGPSIGDKISSGVENGGSGNMAARVDVPVARIHSAPLHRRASESCSAVRGSAAAAAAAAAAEKGAATIRPLRIRTAPGMVSLAAAGAETGQEEAATELGSEDFALPALPAADGVTKSPRKLSIVGETFECANVEDEHQLLARRSVALPMDAVSEFGPVASEGHADTDASRLRVNVADADADAIDIAGVDDATLVNATSVATAHGAADATVASVDGDGPCGDGGSSVSRSHLPISLEATDEVKAKPWRDAGFPEDAKYGAAVAERLATAESAAVVYGSTKNGSSSQTVAAVQHFARVSLGAPSHDALTRQTSAAAIPAAVIMAAAGAGASFSRGSTGSLRQRHQTHNGPVSYQQRQQVRLQQRPTFSRLSLASGTGGSGTSINDHSPFCRPSLNAGTESPAIGLMPQHTVGLGLPSASGVSLFARPSLGSLALVPAPAEAAGGGANFASASAGPRFSRPSLGTLPPYAPLAVTATAAAAEAPPPATKWVQAAVLPPGTSPFARPTLTASEQSFHADAISHALATPRGPHWAPAADTNPFVRPSLGTRAVASSRSSETQATAEVPLTQAMKGAASPFARPSLYLQSRGSQAPPPHPPQMAPPPLPLATVGAPPAAGNLFVRPSLGADAHWVPALPLPPGPLPPPSLPSGHPASPGVSPFTRPSLGTRFPGGGALTSPPLVNTASPLPGTNPFARQSWNSVLRSGALPTAVAPPTSVAPPTAVAGTAAAHFTVGPFPMHSLGIPAHGRVSNEAIYTHSEDWRAGAGALSAIASPAVPQSSPYGRLSLNTRGGAAALHVHGAGAPPLTPPPAGPPFSRLTSGSHLPAPSAPLLGPMQGVMPLLLGPSLPALPVGVQILPPSTSSQQKPYQRACHQHEDVPTRYGSAKDAPQTRTLDANAAGASGGVHADGGGSGGGGGNIAVTAGPGAQPGPEITPADSVSDLDVEDMTFGPVAEESVDQARGGLGSPVHGETVAPTGPLEQKHQQLQPPKQEDLHPQAHGRLLAGLQVQTQAVAWSGVPAGAGLQQLQGQMGGAAPDAVSFETTRPPPLPSSALLPQHQHQHHHRHQVWAPGITEAASPGGGFGFGSPVLASLGSEASASVASLGRGSMPNTASTALPSATVPATAATLAAAAAVAAVASVSSRQAPQGAIVDSGNGPAAAAMASPGWISLEGPDRLLPVPLPSYSHAKGVNSGDHLSRSLDSAALFGISEVAQNSAYAFGHGHRHGPQFNKGMVWRDAPLPCVAADGGLWIGGGTSAVCRRRAGTAGPSSHSSGQVGSLSRSYNAMYPSSMPRSAVQTAAPGSWLSPSPPLPLPLGVSSASTRPPPRFQRDSLRTLEAAAATAACGSTGAQTGVNTWDGDREQQQQQRQRQRQQPRQRKAQPRGGLLRALRSAVMPGSHSLRSEPAAAAAAAAATSDSDKERESSGAESGGGGGGGSYRQGGQQPPSFSRRGFSFGNGADDADGDDDGAYADREDVRYRSREGGDSGSRNGHVVMDLLAAGSLTAALAMPRPSRAGAASASQLAEVRIPPQDLPYISSSVPSALAPGMLAGSPGISASVAVASATSTGASRTFVPRFNRLGTVVNGGGGGGAGSSAFNLDVSEHASGTTSTAGIISASGTSFDDAFRLAKSSLSTVPESGPSLSQASITRSSQGSERLMVATGGSGAGGDQTATITPFGRISHRSIGREDAGSGGASGSAMRTHNIAQRNHGSSGSRPRSPEEDHRPPSAEEPMHIVTGARAGARLWPLPEAAPLSSSAPTAVVASVMQRIGVRGAKQSS